MLLPQLTLFASVVFNVECPADEELPVQRLPKIEEKNPLRAVWLKAEALRKQGYLKPTDEERRKKAGHRRNNRDACSPNSKASQAATAGNPASLQIPQIASPQIRRSPRRPAGLSQTN